MDTVETRIARVADGLIGGGEASSPEIRQMMRRLHMPTSSFWRRLWIRRFSPQLLVVDLQYPLRTDDPSRYRAQAETWFLPASEGWQRLTTGYVLEVFGREPPKGTLLAPGGMPAITIEPVEGSGTTFTIQIWWERMVHEEAQGYVEVQWRPEGDAAFGIQGVWGSKLTIDLLTEALVILHHVPREARAEKRKRGRPEGQGTWPNTRAFALDALNFIRDRQAERKSHSKEAFALKLGRSVKTISNWCEDFGASWEDLEREASRRPERGDFRR
jgi:hypothetical protein